MIVDDEPIIREMLADVLRRHFDVTTVPDGKEAISCTRSEHFPVVFLDLKMQGMSGIQTLKVLRSIDPDQKVVILTGQQTMDSAIDAVNLGAFNYLTKPCSSGTLRKVADRAFEEYEKGHQRMQQLRSRMIDIHDNFLSILCHEVNTPLNCIIGYSSLLEEEITHPEQKEAMSQIHQSGHSLHQIFMEMIDYMGAALHQHKNRNDEFEASLLLLMLERQFKDRETSVTFLFRKPLPEVPLMAPLHGIELIVRKLASALSLYSRSLKVALDYQSGKGMFDFIMVDIAQTGLLEASRKFNTRLSNLFEPYFSRSGLDDPRPKGLGLEFPTAKRLSDALGIGLEWTLDDETDVSLHLKIPVVRCG